MELNANSDSFTKRRDVLTKPGEPKGVAWVWGEKDELGRLNLLTKERRLAASSLIRTGETVNIDWQADLPNPPSFGRQAFKHTIKPLGPFGNDDLYEMNTQSGSQWDGFRHVSMQDGERWIYYNNFTQEEVMNSTRGGIQAWAKEGIVGRGVLVDYWTYANEHGKRYDPNTTHRIPLEEILACAEEQKTTFKPGDIFMIRTGYVQRYNNASAAERAEAAAGDMYDHKFVGVGQSESVLDFLHDNYFAAVASDSPAFEAWPPLKEMNLHTYLLPCWGCPIGEMWDLERLAEVCRENNRYEFFFVSSPANVPGGVGCWANALAIF